MDPNVQDSFCPCEIVGFNLFLLMFVLLSALSSHSRILHTSQMIF